jgi:hypothetical protein
MSNVSYYIYTWRFRFADCMQVINEGIWRTDAGLHTRYIEK